MIGLLKQSKTDENNLVKGTGSMTLTDNDVNRTDEDMNRSQEQISFIMRNAIAQIDEKSKEGYSISPTSNRDPTMTKGLGVPAIDTVAQSYDFAGGLG